MQNVMVSGRDCRVATMLGNSKPVRRAFATSARLRTRHGTALSLCLRQVEERPRSRRSGKAEPSNKLQHTEVLRPPFGSESDNATQPSTSASTSNELLAKAEQLLGRFNPSRLSPRIRGLILLNILVLLCGANWVVMKEAEDFLDPYTFAALRFSLAAVVFSPWIKGAVQDRAVLRGGLELGMWSALAYMLQSVGLVTSDASRASFLSTFTVGSNPYSCDPWRMLRAIHVVYHEAHVRCLKLDIVS